MAEFLLIEMDPDVEGFEVVRSFFFQHFIGGGLLVLFLAVILELRLPISMGLCQPLNAHGVLSIGVGMCSCQLLCSLLQLLRCLCS